ncbi:hypothetical protein F5141DRAFT_1221064 [Pisolithus sp. B1]|nr:hypothetical protein F5141DRAFT_1221064 [Pisolithus sp. B1]
MDEDESMVMEIDEAAGQSSSGSRQASSEAGPSIQDHRLSSLMTRSMSKSPFQSRLATPAISRSPSVNRDNWYPIEKSETRRFNILYVPDPSREAIKDLTGCMYKQWANKTGVKVHMTEWLWLIIQMDEYDKGEAFKVDYMLWETFRDIVLDPQANPTAWNELAKKDGIIGSIDYSIDYRSDENAYGLEKDVLVRYESHMKLLVQLTQFWPPIEQIREAGRKWPMICHYKVIAQIKGAYSPRTTILSDGAKIPENTVLKRANSDCGKHVILPTAAPKYRMWRYLKSCINDEEIWMSQEYVETLTTLGEWRAFIIGGRIISMVHTHKRSDGMWSGTPTESFMTCEEIHELIENESQPKNAAELRKGILNPQHGTVMLHDQGKAEFHNFVLDTWRELNGRRIEIETISQRTSTILHERGGANPNNKPVVIL